MWTVYLNRSSFTICINDITLCSPLFEPNAEKKTFHQEKKRKEQEATGEKSFDNLLNNDYHFDKQNTNITFHMIINYIMHTSDFYHNKNQSSLTWHRHTPFNSTLGDKSTIWIMCLLDYLWWFFFDRSNGRQERRINGMIKFIDGFVTLSK